jgi:hypothetical protein
LIQPVNSNISHEKLVDKNEQPVDSMKHEKLVDMKKKPVDSGKSDDYEQLIEVCYCSVLEACPAC